MAVLNGLISCSLYGVDSLRSIFPEDDEAVMRPYEHGVERICAVQKPSTNGLPWIGQFHSRPCRTLPTSSDSSDSSWATKASRAQRRGGGKRQGEFGNPRLSDPSNHAPGDLIACQQTTKTKRGRWGDESSYYGMHSVNETHLSRAHVQPKGERRKVQARIAFAEDRYDVLMYWFCHR